MQEPEANSERELQESQEPTASNGTPSDSGKLGYAHSEYSLASPSTREIISQQCLPLVDDNDGAQSSGLKEGNISDEEIELCSVMLSAEKLSPQTADDGALGGGSRQSNSSLVTLAQPTGGHQRLYFDAHQYELCAHTACNKLAMSGGADLLPPADPCTPELRYEQLLLSAAEQQRYQRQQRLAFSCPNGGCDAVLNACSLLAHFLDAHEALAPQELREGEPLCLALQPQLLLHAPASSCIALLLYRSASGPAAPNSTVPAQQQRWSDHIPLLLILDKTSWNALGSMKSSSGAATDAADVTNLYILWLLCPQAQRPYAVGLDVCDNERGQLRRGLLQTCASVQLLQRGDVLSQSDHFLRLTHGELKLLTCNFTVSMQLELTLREPHQLHQQQ